MATNKTVFSEIFYHKTSACRFELRTWNDSTKFKIEFVPAFQGQKKFDYQGGCAMSFGATEILRLKRIFEALINPQKQNQQFSIEHFFEVNGVKHKSALFLKRVQNNSLNDAAKMQNNPYGYPFIIMGTIHNPIKNTSVSFGFTEEEIYTVISLAPAWAQEFFIENCRVAQENRSSGTSNNANSSKSNTSSNKPSTFDDVDLNNSQGAAGTGGTSSFNSGDFDDISV